MSAEVTAYIAAQPDPQVKGLKALRSFLSGRVSHAGIAVEEVMSYDMPGFRILSSHGQGKMLLGYAAWKAHLALYPHSGTVLSKMTQTTRGLSQTKSALHIPLGDLPSDEVVDKMIRLRMAEMR